jgi:hypothetical protein
MASEFGPHSPFDMPMQLAFRLPVKNKTTVFWELAIGASNPSPLQPVKHAAAQTANRIEMCLRSIAEDFSAVMQFARDILTATALRCQHFENGAETATRKS